MSDYEVLALRYGTGAGTRAGHFYLYRIYDEPDAPHDSDYFFWVVRDGDETILVDCGFDSTTPCHPKRALVVEPVDALAQVGISPDSVSQVLISHCHNDHIGNLTAFPNATLTLQKRELDFWMSDLCTRYPEMFHFEPAELEALRRADKEGRLRIVDGDATVAPGIQLQLVGGHCPGQQITIVDGERGRAVLASDALHFYEQLERGMPHHLFTDLLEVYASYDTLRDYEEQGTSIVAGHDPLVMDRFPPISTATPDLGVRIV